MNADHLINHFNLNQLPFGRAVSEAGLLHHRTFSEALARLSLALSTKTPALFTAEPGLGPFRYVLQMIAHAGGADVGTGGPYVFEQLCGKFKGDQ